MSQTIVAAPDPAVADKLAEYDKTRSPEALKDAADAAAVNDGETLPDPAAAQAMGHARIANWIAILSRFNRDMDPDFDPDHPPSMTIIPPGKYGDQYSPGVNPKDVKDPEMRQAYIAAIEKNRLLLQNFGTHQKLFEAHQIVEERAASSIADAHHSLGLSTQDITALLTHAPISAADRTEILAGVH